MSDRFQPDAGPTQALRRLAPCYRAAERRFRARWPARLARWVRLALLRIGGVEPAARVRRRVASLVDLVPSPPTAGQPQARAPDGDAAADTGGDLGPVVEAYYALQAETALRPVQLLHRAAQLSYSVGRILDDFDAVGTGFLIAPALVMTNHHVLDAPARAEAMTIEFDAYVRENRDKHPTSVWRLRPDRVWVTDATLDYTVVAVEAPATPASAPSRRPIVLDGRSGKGLLNERIHIVQHPGGGFQQLTHRYDRIIDTQRDANEIFYRACTRRGSSGSPVFNTEWQLVALHNAGIRRMGLLRLLGLADGGDAEAAIQDDTPLVAGRGTRISAIVASLEAKARAGQGAASEHARLALAETREAHRADAGGAFRPQRPSFDAGAAAEATQTSTA